MIKHTTLAKERLKNLNRRKNDSWRWKKMEERHSKMKQLEDVKNGYRATISHFSHYSTL